jgi:hypothetical protein
MAHQLTQTLSSKSWQDIARLYKKYGLLLGELARIKETFGFGGFELRRTPDQATAYMRLQASFNQSVVETDSMLIIIEAEIKRRNKLIGVMG